MPTNNNYEERDGGMWRKKSAPDAKHESRINWGRLSSVKEARESVSELRQRQNERNEEYKRSHES